MQTDQFLLSEDILDKRFELGVDAEKMSKILEISLNDYMKLEYGDPSVDLIKFKSALKKLKGL